MYVFGPDWNDRVDTEDGAKRFENLYKMSHYKMIVNHETFHITRIFPNKYQHIAFIEGMDGSANCVFTLKPGEHLMVYSSGCMGDNAVFNTDGIAFVRLIRDCKEVAMWAVDQSPYDYTDEDYDNHELDREEVMENIRKAIKESVEGEMEYEVTSENTLIVGQL
jgi:hypothetical protein